MRVVGAAVLLFGLSMVGAITVRTPAVAPSTPISAARPIGDGPNDLQQPSAHPMPVVEAALVVSGLDRPTSAVVDHRDRIFVTEKAGIVRAVVDGNLVSRPVLDLDARIPDHRTEQGLLSMALHPRFAENGLFYVDFTDEWGDTRVVEYQMVEDLLGPIADPRSARVVMRVPQPGQFHNGGMLQFGPEGHLFVSFGDGGFGRPQANAQQTGSVLGSIVRIDVDTGGTYAVPADNPFVGTASAPEVWAYGMRNPWRFFIDPVDRVLVVADVGQFTSEEITVLPLDRGGLNLGWPVVEGDSCYLDENCDPGGFVMPTLTYAHTTGCAVVGGPVYRGSAIPALEGMVVYADFCTGFVKAFGVIQGHVVRRADLVAPATHGPILAIAVDGDGEILLLTQAGEIRRVQPAP